MSEQREPAAPGHLDGLFGPSADDDGWIDRVRSAEAPLAFGCLGRYELLEEVHRGGQGVVFRAVHRDHGRQVALKRLLGGTFATASMRWRFTREMEALAALHHPHIVCAFAMDVVDGVPVLAMEWIDGVSITEWAGGGGQRRAARQIVAMFVEICDAVTHAHQRGVLHRDLKPSNILIDKDEAPHVLDFGLAKLTGQTSRDEASVSVSGEFLGTPAYAPPEQLRGDIDLIDARSDVFALGVILYEMLTGRLPFATDRRDEDPRAFVSGRHEGLPELASGTDRDLEAVTRKALAAAPARRYQSVDALAADLRAWLAGEAVTARMPGRMASLLRALRRHWLATTLAAAVFVLAVALATVAMAMAARIADERDVAVTARQHETEARDQATAEAAQATAMRDFLVQMISSADPMRGGGDQLTVRAMLDSAAQRLGTELADQPEVEAEVRRVLGVTYHSMGLHDDAEQHLRSAVDLERSRVQGDHAGLAVALNELGHLITSRGDYANAQEILSDALRMRRSLLGDGHPDVATSLNNLAKVIHLQGRLAEAEPLWREALGVRLRHLGDDHPLTASSFHNLASSLMEQGRAADAEPLLRQALDISRRVSGDGHIDVGFTLHMLGRLAAQQGRAAEAEALYSEALENKRRNLIEHHPAIGMTLDHLGRLLLAAGRLDEAERAFEEALQIYRGSLGEEHPHIASVLVGLGRTLAAQGDRAGAEAMLRRGLVMSRRWFDEDHALVTEAAAALDGLGPEER